MTQPQDQFSLFRLPPSRLEHIQFWADRLVHQKSLPVSGPCRPSGAIDAPRQCRAPPYPLFPLPEVHRNKLLMRPPPEVVRANIQIATGGLLSTVDEIVQRVNANLNDLGVLGDDVLTLLATNFREPEAGLTVRLAAGLLIMMGSGRRISLFLRRSSERCWWRIFMLLGTRGISRGGMRR